MHMGARTNVLPFGGMWRRSQLALSNRGPGSASC